MIESAFGFIRASRLLWQRNLGCQAMVNAAIGLEILFKSFNSEIDGPKGGIGEQYKFVGRPTHDLLQLFDAIPESSRVELGLETYRDFFHDNAKKIFVDARYPYERGGVDGGTDAFVEIAEEMIDMVIQAYKKQGCNDPWIIGQK
jgi:hypothetical protein